MKKTWMLGVLLLAACDASVVGVSKDGDEQGPPLTADPVALAASLACHGELSARRPVLLVHGTAVDVANNFGWNYAPALTALGIPFCTVQMPGNGMPDIQDSAEYVVYAIREMHRLSGQKVQIVGHSQGGMIPRWALKFWPDTRPMVDDVIGLAASNHGTVVSIPFCAAPGGCAPSFWQQTQGSNFLAALNEGGETYEGISYTSVYTYFDEIVVPNLPLDSSTSLAGGTNAVNLATQDICPTNTAEHLTIGTSDAAAFAAVLDALSNDGPADVLRIPLTVCAEPFMPGVDPASFATDFAGTGQAIAQSIQSAAKVTAEPALKCYVTGSC